MNTVIAFPGQGSQRVGMFAEVPETEDLERLLDAAEALTGLDLRRLSTEGTPAELADTRVAQPLLYLIDWAWGRALLDVGAEPVALTGHSLGELVALALADVFSVEAGLELVCARAGMMAEAIEVVPGTMAAVLGLDGASVASAVEPVAGVWVANDNAVGQVVISGTHVGVLAARAILETAGARRIVPLDVSGPFHTPLMAPAADEFARMLDETEFQMARIPVIQNTRPVPATDSGEIRDALKHQMAGTVRWTETMSYVASLSPVTVIEAGPGAVLSGLARRVEGVEAVSVEGVDLQSIVEGVMQ